MQIRRSTGLLILSLMTAFFLAACGGGGGGGGSSAPDLSPGIIQVSTSNVTNNSAVLQATVNPKGSPTTAWFVYSKDPNLSSNITTTVPQNLGSGSSNITVTQAISGLEIGKTYYYRVMVHNDAGGTKEGTIFTFNTLPLPVVQTGNVTSITTSGADLHAIINPNGVPTFAWFEYGKTSVLGTFLDNQSRGSGTDNVNIISTLIGLDFATQYYYRIVAQNQNGIALGSTLNFTTAGGVPTVVTNSNPTVTTTSAILSGQVNPNGLPTSAWFEYGETSSLGSIWDNQSRGSGTASVAVTALSLTGLKEATLYYYRIAAKNGAGTTQYGDPFTFTTAGGVPLVTTKSAISVTTTGGVLRADVNPSGLATNAWFEYSTNSSFTSYLTTDNQAVAAGASAVEITATLSGRTLGETIYYRVAASNVVGPSLKGDVFNFTTLNPPPTANAGPDQSVFTRSNVGATLNTTVATPVTLDASGSSTDPSKKITSYAWTQLSGTAVTLDNSTSPTPSFSAPQFAYGPSQDLVFGVTATDNSGLSGTDNVMVTVNWGFLDDFSTNTTATYAVVESPDPNAGAFAYGTQVANVTTGTGNIIFFSHMFDFDPGHSNSVGVFSLDYRPLLMHGSIGGVVFSLGDSSNTYYRISTLPGTNFIEKWRAGVLRAFSGPFTGTITTNITYPIKITFNHSVTTVEAFEQVITLGGGDYPVPVDFFSVLTQEQDANYDNIKLGIHP